MGNKVIVTKNKLDLLADSISAKSGESLPLTIGEMKIAVDGIVLNSYIIGDGDLNVDENDYLYFDDEGEMVLGTKTITENGTYNASSDSLSGYSSVTVNVAGSSTTQTQTKTATPTESQQTITPDNGYLLSSVTVNAISSTYVGSGITQRSVSDITVSGSTVNVPYGYYEEGSLVSVSSITHVKPTISIDTTTGLITATHQQSQSGYLNSGTTTATEQLSTQNGTTITPTESSQVAVAANKYTLGDVKVGAISSTYVGSGITSRSSTDLTVSGATVTAPAGYYSESVSKSVASGTAGTPSASKGTVSNHSISVTPSVTNTTGYITGGTKTGTAVTVTASELASGNKEITSNGTDIDVVGYSTVSVAVPGASLQAKTGINPTTSSQTITADSGYDGLSSVQINAMPSGSASTPATTITANPSISVSSSGLITATASASQNITPTVSAGYVSSGTAGTVTVSGSKTQQLTTKGSTTYNTSTTDQTIASGTYLTGTQTIKAVTVSGLDASKILSGTTVMVGDANDADRIASVTGTVTFSTITISSSNPSGGNNGDIWIKTS